MTKVRILFLLSILSISFYLPAQKPVSNTITNRLLSNNSAKENFMLLPFHNPALQYYRHKYSLSELSLSYNYNEKELPELQQEGKGWQGFHIGARSFLKTDSISRVWGSARYENGEIKQVGWNESSDFTLLYPYVTADSIGGNLKSETYYFAGGYARQQKHFTWGTALSYRANISYRNVDPRPRNIVSDLHINLGAAWKFIPRYSLGISGSFRKYKQTNDIKFYSDFGQTRLLHLLGLGMDYARFAGSNRNTFYKGYQWGGALSLFPRPGKGMVATLQYSKFSFDKNLVDLNNLPINRATENTWTGEIGWLHHLWGIKLTAQQGKRKGFENLFGEAAGNSYPQIGSIESFGNHQINTKLSAFYENQSRNHYTWSFRPQAGYRQIKTEYLMPYRKLELKETNLGLLLSSSRTKENQLFHLEGEINYRKNIYANIQITEIDDDEPILQMLENNYKMLSANRTRLRLAGRYDYSGWTKEKTLFAKAEWQHDWQTQHIPADWISITIGIVL